MDTNTLHFSVDIMRGGIHLFPSQCGLAATGDPSLVETIMRVVGRQLRVLGINWVHSPVLDVNLQPLNPEIGMRAFSDDPEVVGRYGEAVMKGLVKIAGSQWDATVMALQAGNDVVLIREDEATTIKCFEAVRAAVEDGRLSEARLEESVRRILRVKQRAGILADPLPDLDRVDAVIHDTKNANLCRESFQKAAIVVRDRDGLLPLKKDQSLLVVEPYIPFYHDKCNDAWYHPGMFGEAVRQHTNRRLYQETHVPPRDEDIQRFRRRVNHNPGNDREMDALPG